VAVVFKLKNVKRVLYFELWCSRCIFQWTTSAGLEQVTL